MKKIVLVDGARTPFLKAGTIPGLTASELGVAPAKALIKRYPAIPLAVDYVIGANIGNQILHPDGSNLGRVLALRSGIPLNVGAWTVNVNCATGLHAVIDAAKTIATSSAKCVLVITAEVMSDFSAVYSRNQRAEFIKLLNLLRAKKKSLRSVPGFLAQWLKIQTMRHNPLWTIDLGLVDPMTKLRMDQGADLLAETHRVSREEQDLFALRSQRLAFAAQKSGRLAKEIVPFRDLAEDNGIRPNQNLEQLSNLKPLHPGGTVTAGNSSQLTDGACALLVADEEFAKFMGWPILTKIRADWWALAGCDPKAFGYAPVFAIQKLLDISRKQISDFDFIETNEAFAAVALTQMKALDLPEERTNVNGGAIAIGHPLSASGARLVLSCAKELQLSQKALGLVTLCIGGGQGEAIILENA